MSETYTKDLLRGPPSRVNEICRRDSAFNPRSGPPVQRCGLGCGEGAWLAAFAKNGVLDVLGVDGDYVDRDTSANIRKNVSDGRSLEASRTSGEDLIWQFRWKSLSICHRNVRPSFVESLTRLAPSRSCSRRPSHSKAALQHVNEQWPDKWAELFENDGYLMVDCIRRRVWQNNAVDWWYAQNMLDVSRSNLLEENASLRAGVRQTNPSQLRLVHPRNYLEAFAPIRPPAWGVGTAAHYFALPPQRYARRLLHIGRERRAVQGTTEPPKL